MIPQEKQQWSKVKTALRQKTEASLKLAIIEANKVFMDYIEDKGIKADSSREVLSIVYHNLDVPEKLSVSIQAYEKIIHGQDLKIKYEEVKKLITNYYQAMLSLEDGGSIRLLKLKYQYCQFLKSMKMIFKEFKYIVVIIFLVLIGIVVVTTSTFGQAIASGISRFANMVFFSFLPALFIGIAIVLMVIGTIVFYTRKPRVDVDKFTIQEDDEDDVIEIKG